MRPRTAEGTVCMGPLVAVVVFHLDNQLEKKLTIDGVNARTTQETSCTRSW